MITWTTFLRRLSCAAAAMCLVGGLGCEKPLPPTSSAASNAQDGAVAAMTAASSCDEECFAILQEAISWVSRTRDVAAGRLLVDSVGDARSPHTRSKGLPRSVLNDLAVSMGANGLSAVETMARCFGSPFDSVPPACQPLADKIMVTLSAPVVSETDGTRASLEIVESWNAEPWPHGRRAWIRNGYTLTLQRATNGWRVVDAKLVFQT